MQFIDRTVVKEVFMEVEEVLKVVKNIAKAVEAVIDIFAD